VFASAEGTRGFVDRSRFDHETQENSWGPFVLPEHLGPVGHPRQAPATLSLWDRLEAVAAFAYHGAHGEAMKHRREWFTEIRPNHCAWWVADGHQPDFAEAAERYGILAKDGSTPVAFDLRAPFDAAGGPTKVDADRVRELAAR
jgi:hypothetical protein